MSPSAHRFLASLVAYIGAVGFRASPEWWHLLWLLVISLGIAIAYRAGQREPVRPPPSPSA